jgi:hypothetical protein
MLNVDGMWMYKLAQTFLHENTHKTEQFRWTVEVGKESPGYIIWNPPEE